MRTFVASVAVVLATLGACSGNEPPEDADPLPTAALERAFAEYNDAVDAGDGEAAYEFLAERCRDNISRSDFVKETESEAHALRELYGEPLPRENVKIDRIGGTDSVATVSWQTSEDDENSGSEQDWIAENGSWRTDTCPGLPSRGSPGDGT